MRNGCGTNSSEHGASHCHFSDNGDLNISDTWRISYRAEHTARDFQSNTEVIVPMSIPTHVCYASHCGVMVCPRGLHLAAPVDLARCHALR